FRAIARKPVRPFPAVFRAEARPAFSKLLVKRTLAQATSGFEFAIRPCHLIMQAQDFGDAFAQESAVVRPGGESANIHRPEVHRLLASQHPFSEIFSSAPG